MVARWLGVGPPPCVDNTLYLCIRSLLSWYLFPCLSSAEYTSNRKTGDPIHVHGTKQLTFKGEMCHFNAKVASNRNNDQTNDFHEHSSHLPLVRQKDKPRPKLTPLVEAMSLCWTVMVLNQEKVIFTYFYLL